MKKLYILACAAAACVFASCNNDPQEGATPAGETVNFSIGVSADSRYDMDKGGIGNVSADDYSIRYVLEAYSPYDDDLVARYERFADINDASGTTFNVGLVAQEYYIVVWSDFVPKTAASDESVDMSVEQANAADLYYDTKNGLDQISIILDKYADIVDAAKGGRMVRDAYFGSTYVDLRNGAQNTNIELKRPFARIEIYSESNLAQSAGNPKSVKVSYPFYEIYTAFDALSGEVIPSIRALDNENEDRTISFVDNITESFNEGDGRQIITFDYLFTHSSWMEFNDYVSLKANFYTEPNGAGDELEWCVNVMRKELKRNYVTEISGDMAGGYANIDDLIADAYEGEVIELPAGNYQTTLDFAKSVTIKGPEVNPSEEPAVKIYSNRINAIGQWTPSTDPESDDVKGGLGGYEGRYPLILIDATDAADRVEVTFENVTISTKDVPRDVYWGTDGVTVYGNAKVNFNNVVFENFIRPDVELADQYGRCITVGDGAEVEATNCIFRMFNKNAADILPGGKATFVDCQVYGEGYTPEQAAVKATQNGFVFRYSATGQVSNCKFYNLNYNAGTLNSNAVLLYQITNEANVIKGTDGTVDNNTYENCDANWTVDLAE